MSRAFGLAGLLRMRNLTEERAAVELATARREQQAAATRALQTAEWLDGHAFPDRSDGVTWRATVASRAALAGLLTEQRQHVVSAEQVVATRTDAWTGARRDVRAIEKLEERHDQEVRVEEARAEQAVLDEVGARRASTGQEEA